MKGWRVGLLVVALVLSGCATAPQVDSSQEMQSIKLAMGYIPNVQFTPFYVAVEKGYFEQEGIEIEFDYGMENDLLKLAGTGALQFVVGSGDQVIMARSQGLPVVYVMNWYRRFPVSVAALEPLDSPQALVGKSVGIPGLYGASYIGWLAMLDAAGVDDTEVNLVSIGYTQVESLAAKQVDAAVVYAMNEPVQLRQQGYEVSELFVVDYIDFVSNGLITNENTIEKEPELVQKMVRAALHGLQDTFDDPDAAFEVCRKYVPEIDDEAAPLQRAVLDAALDFWRAGNGATPLGYSDPAAWQASEAFMRQVGMIDQEQDVSAMFSNAFVEKP
ncbi:MAG: ABC transporter substrate-binding protein [Anaerolineae bacterium]|nr:ABC transporter substrate-binding protein [Anaerolineae bacterium]